MEYESWEIDEMKMIANGKYLTKEQVDKLYKDAFPEIYGTTWQKFKGKISRILFNIHCYIRRKMSS